MDVKMKIESTMLNLLNANSKFPKKKFGFNFVESPQNLKDFIIKCEDFHQDLASNKQISFYDFPNKNLRHYYDRNNESLLLHALKRRNTEFISKFSNILSIGINEVYYELTRDPRTEFISKQNIPKPHIILLKSKSEIYGQNYHFKKNWVFIDNIYNLLNRSDICSKVLKIAAENKSLKIFFVPKDNKFDFDAAEAIAQDDISMLFTNKHVYISANIVIEEECLPCNSASLEDELKVANDVIEKLCHVVISMLCLNSFKINKLAIKTSKNESGNAQDIESTVRNVFNSSSLDYFLTLDTGDIIYTFRTLQNDDADIKFESLPEPMQKRITSSEINFQGARVALSNIIGNNFEILRHLPSKSIKDILIRNLTINIGDDVVADNYDKIFDRKLIEQSNNQFISSKISFLVDDIGAGKTSTFKKMSANLKRESGSTWVSLINLKSSSEILQNYLSQDIKFEIEVIAKMLMEIIKTKSQFESAVFGSLLRNNKVILLIDDIDKIEPVLSEFFIKVITWMNDNTDNKLWIATSPVFLDNYTKKFKAIENKFDPNKPLNLSYFMQINHVDENVRIADDLTSFIKALEDRKNGKHYSILNCGMIRAIVQVFDEHQADFEKDSINFYSTFEKVYVKQHKIFSEYSLEKNCDQFESLQISKVHQLHALILIFNNKYPEVQLDNLSIIKNWKREGKKWIKETIGRYGFISFDGDIFHFIHHSYAEFFVAQYLISYIFSDDYCIRDEEFVKIFGILKFMTQHFDDFEIICKFIIGYARTSECEELHETIRDLIKDNIKSIQDDIASSDAALNLKEFWRIIVKTDKELSDLFNVMTY
ncbi:hypothetical protein ACKWTF_015449 [Chironomus riparius]